ncbi:MAG TPA: NADP-dependent oxidoreductase, partial [Candidatus Baltobacteraceae bacterium]|nr:NADP-dependent oxidoreductase [Candidatus Baltobacteraceae bacterium]
MVNREIQLVSRPTGIPTLDNFRLVEAPIPEPVEGQVQVRLTHMSVDPYMRGRMSEARSYVPPFRLGQVMSGGAVGFVTKSLAKELAAGTWVQSDELGFREWGVTEPGKLNKISTDLAPPSYFLGILGMPGLTAWVGLFVIGQLQDNGEVVFISSAGGAVGTVVGQLAKLHGAKVIGSVGTPQKAAFLRDEFGFDAAFDYHDDTVKNLREAAPDGITLYFDNVGGEQLQAALGALRDFGRLVECGMIAQYNEL